MESPTSELYALTDDSGKVQQLIAITKLDILVRDRGEWQTIEDDVDEDPIDGLNMHETTSDFVELYDSARETGALLSADDVIARK